MTKRLIKIFELAEGKELWDIGCDHSLLAKINLNEKKFECVYCVDKSKSSLEKIYSGKSGRLRLNPENIVLIEADGCTLEWPLVNGTVVIAGVGANTILKIVEACPESYRSKLTWIMNPFSSIDKFQQEIEKLLSSEIQKYEVEENKRTRYIYKWTQACLMPNASKE